MFDDVVELVDGVFDSKEGHVVRDFARKIPNIVAKGALKEFLKASEAPGRKLAGVFTITSIADKVVDVAGIDTGRAVRDRLSLTKESIENPYSGELLPMDELPAVSADTAGEAPAQPAAVERSFDP